MGQKSISKLTNAAMIPPVMTCCLLTACKVQNLHGPVVYLPMVTISWKMTLRVPRSLAGAISTAHTGTHQFRETVLFQLGSTAGSDGVRKKEQ